MEPLALFNEREIKTPKRAYAARYVPGDNPDSIHDIIRVAKECDSDADVIAIAAWNVAIIRWTYYGMGIPNTHYDPIRPGEWLVYYDLNDAMGTMSNDQFLRTFKTEE